MAMTIDQIIDYVARTEGGRPKRVHDGRSGPDAPYDAWNADDAGAGVSFGCIQFNQAGGRKAADGRGSPLALLFKTMAKREPGKWATIMGDYADKLTDEQWVKRADLNVPDIKNRILLTARDPDFQRAQREQARLQYFDPARKIAEAQGIKSERGLAMLFDASVQMGPPGASRAMSNARKAAPNADEAGLLASFATTADAQAGGGTTRRRRMLADPAFSDAPPSFDARAALVAAADDVGDEGFALLGVLGAAVLLGGGYWWWKRRQR